jgi:metal-responsive CopG/Arc/MetJ family transcriptional regulator
MAKVLISLPAKMLEEIDQLAEQESRTRSELIREACRAYGKKVDSALNKLDLLKALVTE